MSYNSIDTLFETNNKRECLQVQWLIYDNSIASWSIFWEFIIGYNWLDNYKVLSKYKFWKSVGIDRWIFFFFPKKREKGKTKDN